MLNFFKCQPALNYGWRNPTEPWQFSADSPQALNTRDCVLRIRRPFVRCGQNADRTADFYADCLEYSLLSCASSIASGTVNSPTPVK